MTDPASILHFWFEGVTDGTLINKAAMPFRKWFAKNEKFDQQIRERFGGDLEAARDGKYRSWENSAHGRLALIILYDQFPRNMFRNSPKMFEYDSSALALALKTIRYGWDAQLSLIERTFLYMPLMHSEDLKVQKMSLEYFSKLILEAKERFSQNVPYYEYSFSFAKRHHDIIEKFGCFPHRNSTLGRVSTPEEIQFLTKSGSTF